MNIYIRVTDKCNLHCLHCFAKKGNNTIDIDSVIKCIDNIGEDNYYILHGGEPLLEPVKCKQLMDSLKGNWRITTNLCVPLTNEVLYVLSHVKEIRVSFDYKIRYTKGTLLLWQHNIRYLIKNNFPVILNICITKPIINIGIDRLLKFIRKLGIKRIRLERLSTTGELLNNTYLIPSYKEVDDWLCELYTKGKGIQNDFFKDILLAIEGSPSNCRAHECSLNTLTFNANGTIGRCPNSADSSTIGNLQNLQFTKETVKINNECLKCDLYKDCRGECPQLSWQGNICPFPKKLYRLIKNEYLSNVLL